MYSYDGDGSLGGHNRHFAEGLDKFNEDLVKFGGFRSRDIKVAANRH